MLSDYIPVYWPESNTWSIPSCEIEKYEDYVAKPQDLVLYEGHVVRGIPLLHFGTWGLFCVNVTKTVRKIVRSPNRACAKAFRSKKVAAKTAAFFAELKRNYPEIASVKPFRGGRKPESKYLDVPASAIVKFASEDADMEDDEWAEDDE